MNIKIVVFSWTGNTASIAAALQTALNADLSLLNEVKKREGSKGFALGGFQASFGLKTKLIEIPDISGADIILLGMPVWASSIPPAINCFLSECDLNGKKVYAFLTQQSENRPAKLENKLAAKINTKGGELLHTFVLRVPYKAKITLEDAAMRIDKWCERIYTGK